MTEQDDSAFPMQHHGRADDTGLTAREHAAIQLRVPTSGTPWLDDMIRQSLRNGLAARAMQGFASHDTTAEFQTRGQLGKAASLVADAMMKEMK